MGEQLTQEQLGEQIATLAADIHAATCRWLELVAEFDERGGWADQGAKTCAHWISWRCGIAPGAAREHVRVARRLGSLPLIRAAFARGELSYSKVRALTRVEEVEREAELLGLAKTATAGQLERIVRGYRGVVEAEADRAHARRYLDLSHADDGSVVLRGRLSREEGAVLMRAIEAARDRERPAGSGVSAETSGGADTAPTFGERDADALVLIADESLAAAGATTRSAGERYQVVVHVDEATLRGEPNGRADLDGGEPIAAATARRLCCDASLVALVERNGHPVSVGRRTRAIPASLHRALRSRDGGCQFPGCTQHRWVDAHHIEHWAHGGETKLSNLVQLCRHHHRLVHEGGFTVEGRPGRSLRFRRPDGRVLRAVPRPPRRSDPGCVPAENRRRGVEVDPTTCLPGWAGGRLDLGMAVDAVLDCVAAP